MNAYTWGRQTICVIDLNGTWKSGHLVACLIGTAYAATSISFNIKAAYALELLTAFDVQDDAHVHITIRGSQNAADPNVPDYFAQVDFRTPVRDPNHTDVQYAKKRIALIVDAFRCAHENKLNEDVRSEYYTSGPVFDPNVPSGIVED